jgi:hypothetical protein
LFTRFSRRGTGPPIPALKIIAGLNYQQSSDQLLKFQLLTPEITPIVGAIRCGCPLLARGGRCGGGGSAALLLFSLAALFQLALFVKMLVPGYFFTFIHSIILLQSI